MPAYLIDEIDLHFDLNEDSTLVTSYLRVRHNASVPAKQRFGIKWEGLTHGIHSAK